MRAVNIFITTVLLISGLTAVPANAAEDPTVDPEIPTNTLPDTSLVTQTTLTTDQEPGNPTADSVQLKATTDAPVEQTNDHIEIVDSENDAVVATCTTGTECSYEYTTVDYVSDAQFYARTTNTTSNTVQALNSAPIITLTSTMEEAESWDEYNVELETQGSLPTGKRYFIIDQKTNQVVLSCGNDEFLGCSFIEQLETNESKTYRAYVANANNATQFSALTGIVASSNTRTISRTPWNILLTTDDSYIEEGSSFWLYTKTNQIVPDGLSVYLYNQSTGKFVEPNQKPGDYCNNDYTEKKCITSFAFVKEQTYVAYIAAENSTLTANSTLSSLTDIRAISNTMTVKQIPWNISLTRGGVGGNGGYVYTGHINQPTINYVSALLDSAGKIVTLCEGILECEYSNSVVSTRYTVASYVVGRWSEGVFDDAIQDEPGGSIYDIQASYALTGSGGTSGSSLNSPHSTTGGSNFSQPCPQTCVADPINTVTGEFWLNETDLATKSQIPLQLTRAYSISKRSIQGSLGYGWSTNYDMKISPVGSSVLSSASTLQVTQENGSLITFAKNSAGLWQTDLKTKATLQEQNGNYILTRDKITIFVFNSTGQLTSVKDLNNNTITLTYSSGKLSTVTNNKGQSLSFTWNSNNLISQVQTNGGRSVQYAYNTAKELVTITHADATTQKYTYDTTHALLKQIDERAKATTNVYDSQKRVVEQTDPSGSKTSISYSAQRTEITNPNGRVDQHNFNTSGQVYWVKKGSYSEYYEYDAANNLTLKTYPNGSTLQYTYDANGNALQAKDQAGNVTSYTYNALNLPLSETNAASKTKTYTYDSAGNLTSFTDYNRNVTTSIVNPDGTVQKTTLPNTGTNSYTYNANGLVQTTTNPLGGVGTNTYDSDGQMLTRTDAQNNTTTYTYNAVGLVTNVQHPNTYSDVTTYDAAGNVLTETNRLGDVTTYTYDNLNRVLTLKDPKAKITKKTYDSMGNVDTSTDQLNNVTTFVYDEYGNLIEKTDSNSQSETYSYNNMLQLATTTDNSNGAVWHYSYDANGRVVQTTNPMGVKTKVEYNNLGLPIKTVDEQKKATSYTYDDNGNTLTTTRPDLTVETNTYNALNLNASRTDSAGGVKEWSYNLAGSPTSFTNTDNTVTTYEYNNVGLPVKETRPDNTNVFYEYQFNKLSKETHSDSVLEYEYNNAGYLTKEKQGTDVITYTYDKNGNIVSRGKTGQLVSYLYTNRNEISRITYPSGKQMNYVYDSVGNLTSATNAQTGIFNYTYDDSRNVTNIENPNGVQQAFTYNNSRQMTSNVITSSAEFYNKSYTYNGSSGYLNSTTTKVAQPTEEELNESYSYDARGRLVKVEADQTNEGTYGYSNTGNLTNNFGSTQTFNTGNRLTSTPQNSYSFDGRGNRTKDVTSNATVNMVFNQEDKLTSWTKGSTNVQYQYDANGLIKKRTQGSTNQNFIWDYNNSVPLLLDDGKYEYLYGESNTPVAQIEKSNGKVTYLHADSLGTVTFATKVNGDQAALYVYDAYGKLNTSWSTDVSRTVTRFGYAGEWADPTTGLYNLRARWYEPTTGTFLSEDPLVQFTNEAYGYSSGNPLLYTDPLGLFSQEWESGQARQQFFASEGFRSFVNGFTSVVITGGAIALGAACIAATAGICGGAIGSALVIGAIGAGSSSLDYALTERCQSPQGWMAAAVIGGLTGGKGKAAGKVVDEGIDVFRAVQNIELDDLKKVGVFRVPPGGVDGKYFAENADQAKRFGDLMAPIDKEPYTVVKGSMPRNIYNDSQHFYLGELGPGPKAILTPPNLVDQIKFLGVE